jgi:hypothetical protein
MAALRISVRIACTVAWACLCIGCSPAKNVLSITPLAPAHEHTIEVAISPDGTRVATLHRNFSAMPQASPKVQDSIDVQDAASGHLLLSGALPPWQPTPAYRVSGSAPLTYCDNGKYLVVANGPNQLEVIDAQTLQLHLHLVLSDLLAVTSSGSLAPYEKDLPFYNDVPFGCALTGPAAVLVFHGDVGLLAIRLFNLDTGTITADWARSFTNRFQGDGIAFSPDGSRLAMVTWNFASRQGDQVEVIDAQSGKHLNTLPLNDPSFVKHQLAFAGNGAVIIGEYPCQYYDVCGFRNVNARHDRKLRIWNLAANGTVRELGRPGAETYRSFGASADDSRIFSYTGAESYCSSCNNKAGEIKIDDARFVVWDQSSGRVFARSAALPIEIHKCPWLTFGACESWQQVPQLQLSADGKAILAFWQQDFARPQSEQEKKFTNLEVYRLP